jgi:PAS domain S-box-containing protein
MRANDFVKPAGPLMSWDVYLNFYRRMTALANDKASLDRMAFENKWRHKFDFEQQLFHQQNTIIVTSPSLNIVYASSNVVQMTGYYPDELMGKNPSILQGPDTDTSTRSIIRQAVDSKTPFEKKLVNYRKNGEKYHCEIKGFPLFNREKQLVNFIAFEKEITV